MRRPRAHDPERPEQPAKHIEVVDQHLGDHQPLLFRHEGLALQGRAPAVGVREQARRQGRHIGLQQLAGLAGLEPALHAAIPRAKAPVLVDHQPGLARHAPGERRAGVESWCQGLLTKHVDPFGRGGLHQRRMGIAGRGDIDGIELAAGEHVVEIAVDLRDGELRGAALGLRQIGIAKGDDLCPRVPGPGDEMVMADHPGAGEADPQRRPSPRFRCRRHAENPRRRAGLRRSTRSRSAASGSQRSRTAGHRHSGCCG